MRKIAKAIKPDVVHGWGGELGRGLVATYLSRSAAVSVQGLLRMLNNSRIDRENREKKEFGWVKLFLEWLCYRRAGRLLCESETAKRELLERYGMEGEVVWQPLREEFISHKEHKEHKEESSSASSSSREVVKFLFVGQAVKRKGIEDVKKAFEMVGRVCPQTAELEIVSEGKSAAEMVELMRRADALVMPSYGDTGPTVVKEAISQGLWPIVYSGSGAEELVKRYRFGSVVKCGDVEGLAREMISRVEMSSSASSSSRVDVQPSTFNLQPSARIRVDLSRENVWGMLLEVYREQLSGVEVVVQPGSSAAILQRCKHLRRIVSHLSPLTSHLVISSCTGMRQNLVVAIRAKLRGQKVIREINEWPFSVTWNESKLKQWFEIHVLPKFFDGFICMTDLLVDFCREHGRKNVPIFKWPMSVDVEENNSRVEHKDHKDNGRVDRENREKGYIAYAGGMSEVKDGVETLKRACEGYELKMLSGLERMELMRELSGAAALLVVRPDTLQNRAGFPTKLGEFLALGRPVIVTNVGEIGRFLKDGVNAFVIDIGENNSRVEHKDHKEYMEKKIREKLREVFADRERAERIGAAGREVAIKCFDYKVYAEDLRRWLECV